MVLKYATGNATKVAGAKKFLEPLGITVEQVNIDIPELQADTNEEVAIESSKYAFSKLNEMVLKNDGGLVIPALKGFPGVYTRYVEETIGAEGILKLMSDLEGDDRSAYFIECLALTEEDGNTKIFTCKTPGHISFEQSGSYGWGYDRIFIPDGETQTLGNFEDDKRLQFWSMDAYIELGNYLNNKK